MRESDIVVSKYNIKSGGFIILDYYLIYCNRRKKCEQYAMNVMI